MVRLGVSKRGFVVAAAAIACLLASPSVAFAPARAAGPKRFHDDVVYSRVGRHPLTADIFVPAGAEREPVLILVHGGSWQRGSKEEWEHHSLDFVRAGFVVVAIDYRLVHPNGDAVFPQPVGDVSRAIAWVKRNISSYGGDRRRIGVLGGSAGAYLTLMAAARDRRLPDAIGLLSPPVALARLYRQGILVKPLEHLFGCTPEGCPRVYREASGARAVRRKMPSTLLAFSRDEVLPRDQGLRLSRKLREVRADHVTYELPGTAHSVGMLPRLFDETVEFFESEL